MSDSNWQGKKIVVLGAARQGLALAGYLAMHNARVVLNDMKTPDQLSGNLQTLRQMGVEMVFGSHPLELLDNAQMVCLSGGIPLSLPIVQKAMQSGIKLSNDSQIFMEAVPCKTIGITGSAGKTTTTTLVGRMAEADQKCIVWVGGNIGLPLISLVDQMKSDDLVVMELSSFQLEQMTISPNVAAVLNITPNHLDRHKTMQAYTAAKSHILIHQKPGDVAVLNRDDEGSWSLKEKIIGRQYSFGFDKPSYPYYGTSIHNDWIYLSSGTHEEKLMPRNLILLKGEHNLSNILAACAIAAAAGFSAESMIAGVAGFNGVPHRLELVRVLHGVAWYNDSIATAPERTMAAIHSFQEPIVLMLGGRDKKLPWEPLIALINDRVDHVVLFGEAGSMIERMLKEVQGKERPYSVSLHEKLEDAIVAAHQVAQTGDVVLLSPGCTSFDAFKDFEERGEKFRQWVNSLS
jgi:UDP-N-acetylmuramoylalanine--D-glutamate ligase